MKIPTLSNPPTETVSDCSCGCHKYGSPHYTSEPCCKDALVYPKPNNPPTEPTFHRANNENSVCVYCKTKIGMAMKCPGCGHIDPPVTTLEPTVEKWEEILKKAEKYVRTNSVYYGNDQYRLSMTDWLYFIKGVANEVEAHSLQEAISDTQEQIEPMMGGLTWNDLPSPQSTEPTIEKWVRNPSCELWCNLCGKHVPAEGVKINYSIDGHIIFSHHTNHLLELEIDISHSVQEAKAEMEDKITKKLEMHERITSNLLTEYKRKNKTKTYRLGELTGQFNATYILKDDLLSSLKQKGLI